MSDLLLTLASFIVALGLLIAVHEFGHFWVARRVGVQVLRFSIGFGKPLLRWQGRDGTEFVIAALPLGGYVKMLDEREGEVAPADQPRAFNRQSLPKRSAVVIAGPLFNLLFAVLAYWGMYLVGVPGTPAMVGEVTANSPAAIAGLVRGDTIERVDGVATPTWGALIDRLLPALVRGESVQVESRRDATQYQHALDLTTLRGLPPDEAITAIGMRPWQPALPPVIGEVVADSPAAQSGLQSGDRILTIAGEPISEWQQAVTLIRNHPGEPLTLVIERDAAVQTLTVRPLTIRSSDGTPPIGRIGAGVAVDPTELTHYQAVWQLDAAAALPAALNKTAEMSLLTLQVLFDMVRGSASVEHISGPITIAQVAKRSADAGFSRFLAFLAVVSVSLGILNLLPIPVLDGGHLLYFLIEAVKGSPLSERSEALGQKLGMLLLAALMMLAFYNDLARLAN